MLRTRRYLDTQVLCGFDSRRRCPAHQRVVIKPANQHLERMRTGSSGECHAGWTTAGHGQVRGGGRPGCAGRSQARRLGHVPAGARSPRHAACAKRRRKTPCASSGRAAPDAQAQGQGASRAAAGDQCADQRRRECGQAGRAAARAPAPQPRRKDGGGRGRRAGSAPTPSGRPAPAPMRGPAGSRRPRTGSGP